MKRRSFLAAAAVFAPQWARAEEIAPAIHDLAKTVLPSQVDARRVAEDFLQWVRDYKPGAEIASGYGHPRTQVTPPNPSAHYAEQLRALGSPITRTAIEAALAEAKIERIPPRPNGRHVAADLLAHFYGSSQGEDFLYNAAIRRDDCRGLANSAERPERLS